MIFSLRHYCNIYQIQRPIRSIASGQDCSILLQYFEEENKNFNTTNALLIKMNQFLYFSNFLILGLFSGSLLNDINMVSD